MSVVAHLRNPMSAPVCLTQFNVAVLWILSPAFYNGSMDIE